MVSITVSELAAACGGVVVRDTGEKFSGVSIDSRTIRPGNIFFALKGENFDGHDFIDNAFKAGAAGAVVEKRTEASEDGTVILVENTLAALQKLAAWWRNKLAIPLVGITGSSGKTTTKDILASLLYAAANVHFNTGNQNNEIGVPLTLLSLSHEHDVCVLEMGMRGLGEIGELCSIAKPTAGIITNVGSTHFERLGSMSNIALAKVSWLKAFPRRVLFFSMGKTSGHLSLRVGPRHAPCFLGSVIMLRCGLEKLSFFLSTRNFPLRLLVFPEG